MTLLYGGVFTVITVAVLFAAERFQQSSVKKTMHGFTRPGSIGEVPCELRPPESPCSAIPYDPAPGTGSRVALVREADGLQHSLVSTQRLISVVAILVIVVLAFAVCWWLTGRILRPLHRVTAAARRLSLSTLHERIALTGPQDELKDLADTFDAMLDRLEHAVAGQRRFVANASHELRTPLTIQRAAVEIGLADPSPEQVARIRTELLHNTQRSERLIEGLLALAHGERGLDTRAPVHLATVIEQVVAEHRPLAQARDVAITVTTRPSTVSGDEVLVHRLAANLVHNAILYNHPGGRVTVELSPDAGLVVRNTGPHVPADRVDELFEPFRRLRPTRTGPADGTGLGLSIVAAIAHAHDGTVHARPNPDGGLTLTVTLPASDSPSPDRP